MSATPDSDDWHLRQSQSPTPHLVFNVLSTQVPRERTQASPRSPWGPSTQAQPRSVSSTVCAAMGGSRTPRCRCLLLTLLP